MKKLLLLLLTTCAITGATMNTRAQVNSTITRTVATGNDDAEEAAPGGSGTPGSMDLTSSDLELIYDGTKNQYVGIRFSNLSLPKGAIIDSAFIQFTNKGDKTPVFGSAIIKAQLTDSAATFTSTNFNISSRTFSTDSLIWAGDTSASWGTSQVNARTLTQRTPDIKTLIQALVNHSGWKNGNALCLMLTGAGVRNTQSYNGSTSLAPQLIVHFRAYPELLSPNGGETWQAGSLQNISWNANGVQTMKIQYTTTGSSWTDITPAYPANLGYYQWTVPNTVSSTVKIRISDSANIATLDTSGAFFTIASDTLIAQNGSWKYKDDGSNQDTAWRFPSFNDSTWASGNAEFGYGDGGETTLVNACGTVTQSPTCSNKYITTYFRKKVFIPNLNNFNSFDLGVVRDDGVVVYVNGTEVWRDNIGTGTVGYTTLAPVAIGGGDESAYQLATIAKTYFVQGWNTIAVEMHQQSGTSSDLSFNLRLKGNQVSVTPLAPATITSPNGGELLYGNGTQNITWTMNAVAKLKIESSTNGGSTWSTIVNGIASSAGSYSWSIPNTPSSNCMIRIADSANVNAFDTSNARFSILTPPAPFNPCANPNHIGCFTSVQPMAQTQLFRYPTASHTFQRIIKTGDALTFGGTLGANNDFTGYVAAGGSSKRGSIAINHETDPGGVSIVYARFNDSTGLWVKDSSGAVNFSAAGLVKTIRNCSGGVTPWGTVVTSEESYNTGDANADGYTDVGWNIEVNPLTRQVMDYNNDGLKDKLWAMGRMSHENIVFKNDSLTAYQAEDGGSNGLYKFVAFQKMRFDSGSLYVMQRTGSTGNWIPVPNSTQAQRNTVSSTIAGLGGTNFNGAEDVEINPVNGMIYFTSKGNSMIYRFTDNGSTVSNFENYVGNSAVTYNINYGSGTASEQWNSGIDNLVFDDLGNLWAQQDGSRNHLWVIRPDHTPSNPKVELFATTPSGSEPTGLTFTPDYTYGFLSFQHPSGSNALNQVDAAGDSITLNTHTTIVIANKNFLGSAAALPVEFLHFGLARKGRSNVVVTWTTASETNNDFYTVERSYNGADFEPVGKVKGAGNSNSPLQYSFMSMSLPPSVIYYRIRQTDLDGRYSYSVIKSINLGDRGMEFSFQDVFPNPFNNEVALDITAAKAADLNLNIVDLNSRPVYSSVLKATAGNNHVMLPLSDLAEGVYILTVSDGQSKQSFKLIKQ